MPNNPHKRVTISDPGFRVSRQVAIACQSRDLLDVYFTSIFLSPDSIPFRLSSLLPSELGQHTRAHLSKRSVSELNPDLVVSIPVPELTARAKMRLVSRLTGRARNKSIASYQEAFDRRVARKLDGSEGLIYANEGNAHHTFRRAKELNIPTFLEGVWHPAFITQVMEAECDHFGVKPDTLSYRTQQNLAEIALADFIFTQSEFARKTFLDAGYPEDQVVSIPLGVDLELFQYREKHPKPIQGALNLISVGTLSIRKGTGRLLEALIDIDDPRIKIEFIGAIEETFKPIWARFYPQLERQVQWHPPIPRIQLVERYRHADALVLPSICDSFGQVIIESMAVGTPVVVTSSCGAPVRHEVDGLVIPPANQAAIVEAFLRLIECPHDIQQWSVNAAAQSRCYSWERFREQIGAYIAERVRD